MLSYYVIYYEKFRTVMQRTEKVDLITDQIWWDMAIDYPRCFALKSAAPFGVKQINMIQGTGNYTHYTTKMEWQTEVLNVI